LTYHKHYDNFVERLFAITFGGFAPGVAGRLDGRCSERPRGLPLEAEPLKTANRASARAGRAERVERGSISAEQIIAGALQLAEEIGIEALSMPKLASQLGIGVTSIYWYFRSKNELMEALTVEAARTFHGLIKPPDDADWEEWLFALFLRLRNAMRANPVYCDLLFMRGHRASEGALMHTWPGAEATAGRMVAAGFTPHEAVQNMVMLSLYTRGSVVLERQMQRVGISPDDSTPVPPQFPLLSEGLKRQNMRGISEDAHAAQLRLLIDGMALRLRAKQQA
jgi:AcrR family transcriptional regulator